MPGIIEHKYLIKFKAHCKSILYINITIHSKIYEIYEFFLKKILTKGEAFI